MQIGECTNLLENSAELISITYGSCAFAFYYIFICHIISIDHVLLCRLGAPCLSFDILQDSLGDKRESYPMTNYIVCGTQAERSHTNAVIVMKLSNMHRSVIGVQQKGSTIHQLSQRGRNEIQNLNFQLILIGSSLHFNYYKKTYTFFIITC